MKTIRTYISVFLVASSMFVALPSQAKNSALTKPSAQTLSCFAIQVKDAVFASPYISASIVAGVLAGSCFCYKYFFGGSATARPIIEQAAKQSIKQYVEPIVEQDAKPIVKQDVVLQERLAKPIEKVAKSKPASPVARSIVKDNRAKQVVKVTNDQDQSLNICVASANDGFAQQFAIPSYRYSEISVN